MYSQDRGYYYLKSEGSASILITAPFPWTPTVRGVQCLFITQVLPPRTSLNAENLKSWRIQSRLHPQHPTPKVVEEAEANLEAALESTFVLEVAVIAVEDGRQSFANVCCWKGKASMMRRTMKRLQREPRGTRGDS